ncbi:hypothetical protein CN918_31100 [Priestia megaterium]|nr:hypothetical protein CN918_31100 [Priestia megaterium]
MASKNDKDKNRRDKMTLIKNDNPKETGAETMGWRRAAEAVNKSGSDRTVEQITADLYKMREENKFND